MKTKLFIFTFIIFLFSNLINAAPPTNTWSVLDAPLTEGQLPMTASGTLIWGDYNNDGHLDAFIIAGQGTPVVGLYKNNGDETFTPIATNITALNQGAAVFLDYNNDGNLDLLIAGKTDAPQTILYKNTGAPNYTFEVDNENTEILVNVFPEGNDNSPRILEAFDFDNDGWTDILINGNHGATWDANGSQRVVALYKNNKGTFELQSTPYDGGHFTPMNGGSIHVGDVNNDGFDDILVTGYSSRAVTNLYINKQDGTFMLFTPTEDAKFTGHLQGETVFVDINSDGWNDIVEIGRDANNDWASFANIFINNKDNTCTKVPSSYSNLAGGQARIAAGDVNNDGSMDLMVVGWGINAKVFYGDGNNPFTPVALPEEARARAGAVNMVDFNNDNNLDFSNFGYKTGDATEKTPTWPNAFVKNTLGEGVATNTPPTVPTNLAFTYENGQYTITWNKATDDFTHTDAIRYNLYIKYEDNSIFCLVPADITSGKLKVNGLKSFIQTNSIKLNLPEGNYTIGIAAVDQAYASSAFATMDIIPMPKEVAWSVIENPLTEGKLPMTASGSLIWGDYNNDGHLDAFITAGQGSPVVGLYKNNGDETFTAVATSITALNQGAAVFLDYNNDGNLDLLIAGKTDAPQTILYKNTGAPNYTFEIDNENSETLVNVYPEGNDNSTRILEAFDFDNDGWTDILINGNHGETWAENGSQRVVALYKNNKGTFELQSTPYDGGHFTPMNGGSIHVGDANNDGFDDILVTGYSSGAVTNLYINKQDGTFMLFTPTEDAKFTGHLQGETVFVDINSDGWNDIVEIGRDANNDWASFANIFINNKDNTCTKVPSSFSNLTGGQASIAAGDVNNDGFIDLMVVGYGTNSKLFYGNGENPFVQVTLPEEARARAGKINMVDFNNDNNLDFSNFGYKGGDAGANTPTWPNVFVKNTLGEGIPTNTPPTVPTNLAYTYENGQYTITWDEATDDFTHTDAIRYNLYIKYEDNSVYCLVPADITTGRLKVNGLKSFIQTNSVKLNLPEGNYTIGIAAIDQAYASSAFATVDMVVKPKEVDWSVIENPLTEGQLAMSASGTLIWGDYNNDGYMDAFIVAGQGSPVVGLYKNNGDETFTAVTTDITALNQGAAVFLDYNNDGYLDLLTAGKTDVPQTILYKNTGAPDYTFEVDSENTEILVNLFPEGNDNSSRILEAFDYNNDGWTDILVNGNYGATWPESGNSRVVALYKNNKGLFELQTNPVTEIGHFRSVNGGSIHTGDVNNDGFVDIIVTGYHDTDKTVTDLYINNQDGSFTHWADSKNTFTGHMQGETVFVDINGDGWNDIVEIGRDVNNDWANFANIFINNKDNTCTKVPSSYSNLAGGQARIAAGDVNNDGSMDLMVVGWGINAKLFYGDGNNPFMPVALPEEARARAGAVNMVDFNNDDNLDFSNFGYKTGDATEKTPTWPNAFVKNTLGEGIPTNTPPTVPTNLAYTYENGQYTITWDEATDDITHTDAIRYNLYIKYEDNSVYCLVPADITTGRLKVNGLKPFIQTNSVKLNLPEGNYTIGIAAVDQAYASSAFATVDMVVKPKEVDWSVLENPLTEGKLPMSASGTLIWGDYNNDGYMDAFIVAGQGSPVVGLYKNNGDETFTAVTTDITALNQGAAVFLDYNNDGYLDLLTAGKTDVPQTILYKNTGAPDYTFEVDSENTEILVNLFPEGNDNSSRILEAFDYNNDGWTDILVNGNYGATWPESGNSRVVALYKNNKGLFELQTNPVTEIGHFRSVNGGSIHTGDVNNDGFVDIIVTGYHDTDKTVTDLYINNQDGSFTHWADSKNTFTGHMQGETVFVDINGDGWNDIVEIGRDVNNDWANFANIFINNKDNTCTKVPSSYSNLAGGQARIAAGDVNNDGSMDLMVVGWGINAKLFYGDGNNPFMPVALPEEARARAGAVNMVDFNNDDNLDFSNFGYKTGDATEKTPTWPNAFVKNTLGEGIPTNTPPTVPTNLAYTYENGQYTITWDKATDDFTHTDAIRYNLYIKYKDNSLYCLVPADTITGRLKVNGLKSFIQTNSVKLNIPEGNYTIGIAAIDQAYASSTFATINTVYDPSGLQNQLLDNVKVKAVNNTVLIENNLDNNLSFDIFAVDGRLINSNTVNANSTTYVPIHYKGVYLVKLNDGKRTRVEKVIIN